MTSSDVKSLVLLVIATAIAVVELVVFATGGRVGLVIGLIGTGPAVVAAVLQIIERKVLPHLSLTAAGTGFALSLLLVVAGGAIFLPIYVFLLLAGIGPRRMFSAYNKA